MDHTFCLGAYCRISAQSYHGPTTRGISAQLPSYTNIKEIIHKYPSRYQLQHQSSVFLVCEYSPKKFTKAYGVYGRLFCSLCMQGVWYDHQKHSRSLGGSRMNDADRNGRIYPIDAGLREFRTGSDCADIYKRYNLSEPF